MAENKKVVQQYTAPTALPGDLPKAVNGSWVIATAEIPPEDERGGDIVRVAGMKTPARIPLLAQHLHNAPDGSPTVLGSVVEFRDGLVPWKGKAVKAKLARFEWADTELANKYKALWPTHVNTVSIGAMVKDFKPLGPSHEGFDYTDTDLYELSIVTVPANPAAAHLAAIKSALGDRLDLASIETPDDDDDDEDASDEVVLLALKDIRDGVSDLHKLLDGKLEQFTNELNERLDKLECNVFERAFGDQPRANREPGLQHEPSKPPFSNNEARKLLDALRNANYQLSHPQPAA